MVLFKFQKDKELMEIVKKLPDNVKVTNEILEILGNKTTKVEQDKDIKNSYYVYLKDTIYLADNEKNNKGVARICLISHECKHSIQSKILQKINFILSNLELIYFVIACILMIIFNSKIVLFSYIVLAVLSIIPRTILEIDAVLSSVKIANKYLNGKLSEEETSKLVNAYKKSTSSMLPFFVFSLWLGKIIRSVILIVMYVF